jgi:hypothetical protein
LAVAGQPVCPHEPVRSDPPGEAKIMIVTIVTMVAIAAET